MLKWYYNRNKLEEVMIKRMDLHVHSLYSDGDKTPKELLVLAKKQNIGTIAITDHDTVMGLKTLTENDLEDINFINGVEMTAKVDFGRMHILGYGIDPYNDELNKKLEQRFDRLNFLLYVQSLRDDFNISFSNQEIEEILNLPGNINRCNLATLLIKHGYSPSIQRAFDQYLNPVNDICRPKKKGFTEEECIQLINEAGGIAVLAHPKSLKLSKFDLFEKIKYLKQVGLAGLEVIHITQSYEYREYLRSIANKLNLLTSGGTDYHGKIKPEVMLGTGINGNINVKTSTVVDYLTKQNKVKTKCMTK